MKNIATIRERMEKMYGIDNLKLQCQYLALKQMKPEVWWQKYNLIQEFKNRFPVLYR